MTRIRIVHELPKASADKHMRTIDSYIDAFSGLCWFMFDCGLFFLFMHFCLSTVKVVGKFKVKAYASLHVDLYLQESCKQTARQDTSQFLPLLQKKTTVEHKRLHFKKQNKAICPDLRGESCFFRCCHRWEQLSLCFLSCCCDLALTALQWFSPALPAKWNSPKLLRF